MGLANGWIGKDGRSMNELLEYRKEIDEIDTQIVQLFEKRMKVSEAVAGYKIRTGREVLDSVREAPKIASVEEKAHGDFNQQGVRELFHQIMAISRKKQYQMLTSFGTPQDLGFTKVEGLPLEGARVVFQGVEGAYSYAAMKEYFGEGVLSYHVKTWRDAMQEVLDGKVDYAVLPIENSTAGVVGDIYDLLTQYQLTIVGQQVVKVDHVLLGLPGASLSGITKVCSHPQGLMQCREFLEEHPTWTNVQMENTAGSAKYVSESADPSLAAIASREAGDLYGLEVLKDGLCQNLQNATRFIIVGREAIYEGRANVVSITFELSHTAGSLYNMLSHIIYNGLNMTRIESRPIPGRNWEYRFFVDFEGNLEEPSVRNALRGIKAEANSLRILGTMCIGSQE